MDDKNYEKYYYSTERIILAVPAGFEINEELRQYQISRDAIETRAYQSEEMPALPLPLLKKTPFIFLKEENSIYKRGVKMCSRQNFTPNIILKPDQVITAFNMASTGVGATFIPDALVSSVPYDVPLCYYKMDDDLAIRNVYFYKKRNKYMTKAMEEFLKVTAGDGELKPVPVPEKPCGAAGRASRQE